MSEEEKSRVTTNCFVCGIIMRELVCARDKILYFEYNNRTASVTGYNIIFHVSQIRQTISELKNDVAEIAFLCATFPV